MSSDTNPLDLHADTFITDTPIFIDSQLTVSHPLEEVSPTKFELNELPETVIVSKVESEEANPKDSSKIKSPLKSISTAAASALPKVDRMINGSNRHYKTLASNTSEDDERLLQGWYFNVSLPLLIIAILFPVVKDILYSQFSL